jgi:fructuronate reductase
MDGSQKLPQRLLGTIRDRLREGAPIGRLALGVAAWMRYVTGVDENGAPFEVRDPMAARLRTLADAARKDPVQLADSLFGVREIFGDDLPQDTGFTQPVTAALMKLYRDGARRSVAEYSGD